MSRRRKALVLALVPALLLTAYTASQALAAKVTAGKYVATVSGASTSPNVFKIGTGVREISCTATAIGGSLSAASETVSVSGEATQCTSNGLAIPVTGTTNGCTITATFTGISGTTGTANTAVDCPAEEELEVRLYQNATTHAEGITICEYGIPAQGSLKTLETHNSGSGSSEDILATASVGEIKVNGLKGTLILCGVAAGKTTTATYTGSLTATATEEAGAQVGLMVG
ncbi:MAG TPA: hypothetical protein VEW07_01115 [Solirubrobacterales bacterium]|nr:hypothetical protein [Solirubrobacterales bacterium]